MGLVYRPLAAPVTVTVNWHRCPGAIVARESEIPFELVVTGVPAQFGAWPGGTERPPGSGSANETPVAASAGLGLVIVKVSWVVPPVWMSVGVKASEMVGGPSTVRVAVALVPVPPSVDETLPVGFGYWPALEAVTVAEI